MMLKGTLIFQIGCKQSHLEWFDVKCSVLEKQTESELSRVVLIGARCLKCLMPLKATSQKAIMQTDA